MRSVEHLPDWEERLEIEAKFTIAQEQTFQDLLLAPSLAGFSLSPAVVERLHDSYLDTPGRALLAGGYACRFRRKNNQYEATLKGVGKEAGPVHRRIEHTVKLSGPGSPREWPAGDARDLALSLCGDDPLQPLFDLSQVRHVRLVSDGDRLVAELCLDRVQAIRGAREAADYLEIEAELLPDGREQDLEQIVTHLQVEWKLAPQSRSKFYRALALLDSTAR